MCFGSMSYCHASIHYTFSVPCLREGVAHPRFEGTWSCPSSLRCGEGVLSPLAEKHPQGIKCPPPCLTVGWCSWANISPPRAKLMLKSLVLSDHNTSIQFSSGSFPCTLANCRWYFTYAVMSSWTLWELQDFSPSLCSVLPIVFLVTMVQG